MHISVAYNDPSFIETWRQTMDQREKAIADSANSNNQMDWLFAGVGHRPEGERCPWIVGYKTTEQLREYVSACLVGSSESPDMLLWMIGASFRNFIQEELDQRAKV